MLPFLHGALITVLAPALTLGSRVAKVFPLQAGNVKCKLLASSIIKINFKDKTLRFFQVVGKISVSRNKKCTASTRWLTRLKCLNCAIVKFRHDFAIIHTTMELPFIDSQIHILAKLSTFAQKYFKLRSTRIWKREVNDIF